MSDAVPSIALSGRLTLGARVRDRVRLHLAGPLNRTSLSLMSSTLLTAILGLGFWALVARLYPPSEVGRDSVLIGAMAAIAALTQLNLANVIVRFLPQVRRRLGRRVIDGYVSAVALSLLAGVAFVVLAPLITARFSFLRDDLPLAAAFIVSIAATAIFALQDAVLTALGRAPWLPVENGLFSAAKLAVLPLMVVAIAAHGVFFAWILPMFATIPVVNVLIARRVLPAARLAQRDALGVVDVIGWRPLMMFVAQDFAGSALAQVVMIALPLLVIGLLGTNGSAYFYVPFMLVLTFDLMFQAVATSLTAEAARNPGRVREFTRAATRRLVRIQFPACALIVAAAPWILALYGPQYVHHSTALLRLLAAASCFRAVLFLWAATARLQGHGKQLLALQLVSAALLIGLALILVPQHGLVGLGLSWLMAPVLVCLAVGHSLLRFLRAPSVAGSPSCT